MDTLIARLASLTRKQQIIAATGIAVAVGLFFFILNFISRTEEALLYAGLDSRAAGEIAAVLDGEGTAYTVRGSSLYVDAAERDRLRLFLAQQNLPAPKAEGYELLDNLDGFSTTSEMFSVTYWRAKEGEIARTLMTIPAIESARVHIGVGERSLFSRQQADRSASVTLNAPAGLSDQQVRAVRYLIALAVPGLAASEVGVVDTARGLLSESDDPLTDGNDHHAAALEHSLLALLEARVGMGNARVSVAMERIRRREEVESRSVDPQTTAVLSRRTAESSTTEGGAEQALTVASDLPDGEANAAERRRDGRESSEDVSYAVSTVDRRVETLPGGVERLSVAVLLNDLDTDGTSTPRPQAEMDALRELVAAAAGIDPARGDVVSIRSMPFQRTAIESAPEEEAGIVLPPISQLIGGGALLAVGMAFLAFVVRPILKAAPEAPRGMMLAGEFYPEEPAALLAYDPIATLREQSQAKPQAAAALLNAWLEDEEELESA